MFIPIGSNLDQSKRVSKLVKLGDQYLCREESVLFQRVPLPITSRTDSKRVREMINSVTTHLKEETSEDIEHKVWCDTELTTNTQTREEKTATVEKFHATVDELEASMENLAMKEAKLFAQVSNQVDNDPFVKVKKLIQDLI